MTQDKLSPKYSGRFKALKNYRQTIFNQTLFMPTTVVTEEQRQKLKPIFLDLNTFDKSCLKKTFLGIIYRLNTGCT